jgi:chorismate mutase
MAAPDCFQLSTIAAQLEGLEETIIHKLIDRAQYALNQTAYQKGESGFDNDQGGLSLFELRLRAQEEMDSRFGRFTVPEERPFTENLPSPERGAPRGRDTRFPLDNYNAVNLTSDILTFYHDLRPRLCRAGDDGQHGSAVEHDTYALNALSARIHFGAFYVAESKYRTQPAQYQTRIDTSDRTGLLSLLRRPEVEERIIRRVRDKVDHAQGNINNNVRHPIDPDIVVSLYRDRIIPLTCRGEVAYLLQRQNTPAGP